MATTPELETQVAAPETTEAPVSDGDELIHKPEAVTTIETLPASDPTPTPDSKPHDV